MVGRGQSMLKKEVYGKKLVLGEDLWDRVYINSAGKLQCSKKYVQFTSLSK